MPGWARIAFCAGLFSAPRGAGHTAPKRRFSGKERCFLDVYKRQVLFRFAKKPYCTMTPQSAPNKTASTAVLHGSMFSKPCAPAQGRVQRTRAAAQAAAALRLVYHIEKCTIPAGKSQVVSLFYRNITRLPAAFCSRFYKIYSKSLEILWIFPPRLFRLRFYTKTR